jgi:probable HAF family extracellular repeat protein
MFFKRLNGKCQVYLAMVVLVIIPLSRTSATYYEVINIPDTTGLDIDIVGINNRGQVVGYVHRDMWTFLWHKDSGWQNIVQGWVFGISDNGYVIGDFGVWKDGSIVDIGTLGGPKTKVSAISKGGKVAGKSQISTGEWHAFIWDEVGGMRDLGIINDSIVAVNDNIEIAGMFRASGWIMHSFFWDSEHGMVDLGTFGYGCYASDLNTSGQITGSSKFLRPGGGYTSRPYLWEDINSNGVSDPGEMKNLGTLGALGSYGEGINDLGQVVGYFDVYSSKLLHGFIWDELNGMIDLNDRLVEEEGWVFHHATEINNYGEIIGYASDPNNNFAVVLLTPVPDPTLAVNVDIKPGSCPNPLNVKSRGVLPVAILGSEEFDVGSIDAASVRLAGVAPIRSSFEDIGTPLVDANECECSTEGPDGFLDLTLKFKTEDIVEAIGEVDHSDELMLELTGVLSDETHIEGSDCIIIRSRHKPINPADINKDGVVNIVDFSMVADNWLQSSIIKD